MTHCPYIHIPRAPTSSVLQAPCRACLAASILLPSCATQPRRETRTDNHCSSLTSRTQSFPPCPTVSRQQESFTSNRQHSIPLVPAPPAVKTITHLASRSVKSSVAAFPPCPFARRHPTRYVLNLIFSMDSGDWSPPRPRWSRLVRTAFHQHPRPISIHNTCCVPDPLDIKSSIHPVCQVCQSQLSMLPPSMQSHSTLGLT